MAPASLLLLLFGFRKEEGNGAEKDAEMRVELLARVEVLCPLFSSPPQFLLCSIPLFLLNPGNKMKSS